MGYNFAVSGAVAADLQSQAQSFLDAMSASHTAEEWKLLTVLVGGNNLCDVCNDAAGNSDTLFETAMAASFDKLVRLPRLVINVPLHPDYTQLAGLFGGVCDIVLDIVCPCMASPSGSDVLLAREYVGRYNTKLASLVTRFNGAEFDSVRGLGTRFVLQPVGDSTDFSADQSLVADDCFHPSSKGQALLARGVWNNMMQPAGSKSTSVDTASDTVCPVLATTLYGPTDPTPLCFGEPTISFCNGVRKYWGNGPPVS